MIYGYRYVNLINKDKFFKFDKRFDLCMKLCIIIKKKKELKLVDKEV